MEKEYIKIRADFKYAEKGRFYREFFVQRDINLSKLGYIIVNIFGGAFEHMFLFRCGKTDYVHPSWLENDYFNNYVSYYDYSLLDLGDKFTFIYDTGDDWAFNCKVYREHQTLEFNHDDEFPSVIVVDAKGMGIWEDNIASLYAYLEGEIDKDFNGVDEENGIFKPWNFEIDKYSEFDNPIDIEELNDRVMYCEDFDDDSYESDTDEELLN